MVKWKSTNAEAPHARIKDTPLHRRDTHITQGRVVSATQTINPVRQNLQQTNTHPCERGRGFRALMLLVGGPVGISTQMGAKSLRPVSNLHPPVVGFMGSNPTPLTNKAGTF